ncbi:hypothetical protein EV183_000359 [Coemansia sp. RSA 2336]|nr:hypothetical protein EV183_000359 [Coemansia sp. RSA 2336]
MNSLFGGGLPGAAKQTGAANKPGSSTAAKEAAGSSNSAGFSGFGSMFKTALNQVESHLDRYLEFPNEAQSGDQRQQRVSPRRQQAGAEAGRAAESPKSTRLASVEKSRLRPSASSGSLRRQASVASRVRTERAQTPLRDSIGVNEGDISSDLLDAFGVELEDSKPATSIDQTQRAKSEENLGHVSLSASLQQMSESSAAESPAEQSQPGKVEDSDSVQSEATDAKADNPYIQAELKKLREAPIPTNAQEMQQVIEEYRKRIEDLLLEGQSWSAKELRLSNVIKKLRTDSKAYEKTAHMVQNKLDLMVSRNDELNEKLKRASLADRSSSDSVRAMKTKLQDTDNRRRQLEHDLRVSVETRNSLKTALSSAENELNAVRSDLAAAESQQAQAVSNAQQQARVEADRRLADAARDNEQLQARIDELQKRVLVVEEEGREREVSLLTQTRALRAQLRSVDVQNRDIGGEIQQHTFPLLQQIEELQARQTEQRNEWARKEDEWAARVRESAKELDKLQAKLQEQASSIEEANALVDAEKSRADSERAEAKRLREQLLAESKIRAEIKQQLEESRATIRQLNAKLDNMAAQRSISIQEAARSASALSPVAAGHDRFRSGHARTLSSSTASSDSRSRRGSSADNTQSDGINAGSSGTHATIKKLNSQITSLKAQLQTALRQKDEYSRSLVDMSMEVEKLQAEAAKHADLSKELETLKHRHATALEMLGEKTEELMELQADIEDMKQVYKQQLQNFIPPNFASKIDSSEQQKISAIRDTALGTGQAKAASAEQMAESERLREEERREERRLLRKQERRRAKEREELMLDEVAPKETGREAKLAKKRAIGRLRHGEKSLDVDIPDEEIYEDSADSLRALKRERERKERRRQEQQQARDGANRDERLREHAEKERSTIEMLKAMAQQSRAQGLGMMRPQ